MSKSHIEIIEAANSPSRPGLGMPAELVREDTTWFLWNDAVLLTEDKGDASGPVDPLATVYAYEPASFRPAAQIRRVDPEAEAQILIYWLDHLGTPQELSNENGELVWQVALKAWGGFGAPSSSASPRTCAFRASITTTKPACITTASGTMIRRRGVSSILIRLGRRVG